jgi:hypothetical protein
LTVSRTITQAEALDAFFEDSKTKGLLQQLL